MRIYFLISALIFLISQSILCQTRKSLDHYNYYKNFSLNDTTFFRPVSTPDSLRFDLYVPPHWFDDENKKNQGEDRGLVLRLLNEVYDTLTMFDNDSAMQLLATPHNEWKIYYLGKKQLKEYTTYTYYIDRSIYEYEVFYVTDKHSESRELYLLQIHVDYSNRVKAVFMPYFFLGHILSQKELYYRVINNNMLELTKLNLEYSCVRGGEMSDGWGKVFYEDRIRISKCGFIEIVK